MLTNTVYRTSRIFFRRREIAPPRCHHSPPTRFPRSTPRDWQPSRTRPVGRRPGTPRRILRARFRRAWNFLLSFYRSAALYIYNACKPARARAPARPSVRPSVFFFSARSPPAPPPPSVYGAGERRDGQRARSVRSLAARVGTQPRRKGQRHRRTHAAVPFAAQNSTRLPSSRC